jgi:hypothetical protein
MTVRTYEGYWWPEGSEDRTAGRLEVGPDRIELNLNGRFGPLPSGMEGAEYPVIHGVSGTQRITLRQALETGSTFGTSLPTQTFVIVAVWIGAHVSTFTITGLRLQLEYLAEWFQLSAPRRTGAPDASGAVAAAHVPQPPLSADLGIARVTLSALHASESDPGSLKLSSFAGFDVDLPEPRAYDDADHDFVRPLMNLVALATARAPAIIDLTVTVAADSLIESSRSRGDAEVHVLASWLVPAGTDLRALMRDELVFRAHNIATSFGPAIESWLHAHETVGTACDLFFGNLVAPPRFLETKFIVHCQAAEALHGQRFPNLRMSRPDHEVRMKRVLDALTPDDQVWVGNAIRNSNSKSLRDRLADLTQAAPASVRAVIGDEALFADRVVRRRNDVTHGSSLAGGVDELFALNEKLRLLLHAHLMRELGLSVDDVDRLIAGSRLLRSVTFTAQRSAATEASPDAQARERPRSTNAGSTRTQRGP